jgi:hypothetical protein
MRDEGFYVCVYLGDLVEVMEWFESKWLRCGTDLSPGEHEVMVLRKVDISKEESEIYG